MGRRVLNRVFKFEAVKLVHERGKSAVQVARDLRIHQNVLSRWVREARGTFTYKVCHLDTATCSNSVTVKF